MGTLLSRMEEGTAGAEGRLAETGAAALEALTGITASNDDMTGQAESGFASQMSGVMSGASQAFGHLTNGHVQKAQQSASEGTASMQAAVAGFEGALATIGERIDAAIATSLEELDRELSGTLRTLDGKIATAAWKAAEKEQPAWKSVVAIVLVILVIIAAAVISIVTLGAGASLFAIILVGALVGAVSAGLIQIINNWASGEEWHAGLAQAMIMGAIGGAIGGGLGFAGGALVAGCGGRRSACRDTVGDPGRRRSSCRKASRRRSVTSRSARSSTGRGSSWPARCRASASAPIRLVSRTWVRAPHVGVPAPRTSAGAAGGRRAAVTQIAGGAAVGLGVEVAASAVTGQEIDLTRAASAAASGAVGARMSRLGGADVAPPRTGEPAAPRSRCGTGARSVPRVRSRRRRRPRADGARGTWRPGVRPAAGGRRARHASAGGRTGRAAGRGTGGGESRPPEEPEAARPRAPEEAEPVARPRPAEEPDTGRPRTGEAEEGIPTRRPDQDAEGETPPSEHPSPLRVRRPRAKCPCESAKRIITSASAVDRKGLKCGSVPAHAVRSRCGSTICFPTSLRALAHEIS